MSTSRNKTQPTTSKKATVSTTNTRPRRPRRHDPGGRQKTSAARSAAAKTTEAPVRSALPVGFVSFVGSGPGDPELLTVRAVDLLRQAEVVVTEAPEHAALVAAASVPEARRGRRRRLRRGRPAADPRRPRQGRRQAGQAPAGASSG